MHFAMSNLAHPHHYRDRVFGDLQSTLDYVVGALVMEHHAAVIAGADELAEPCGKLAERLSRCVLHPLVYGLDEPERPLLVEARCKSRLCPRCSRIRANELLQQLRFYAEKIDAPRFLTLTLKSSDDPLREQLLRLRRCFAKLRRTKLWKNRVTGGLYTVEVTFNRKSQQWHPHIHAIIDGQYVPQDELKAAWIKASGDSEIVDIRACHSRYDAVGYLADYIAKSSDPQLFPAHAMAEWALNVHGLRLVARFGHLHKAVLPSKELRESINARSLICSAELLASAADEGDPEAEQLLQLLRANSPRYLPDGQPCKPEAVETCDGSYLDRLRAWWRDREELLRERYAPPPTPEEQRRIDNRAERKRKERLRRCRDPVLPFRRPANRASDAT
ncbi:MAG: protein rep [marine benthic group bacterium]|nr:protein rep [Gemmatimonadota bacterium]